RAILVSVAGVALALIPDRPLDAVVDERRDHAVVEGRGLVGALGRVDLEAGRREGGLAHPRLDARAAPARVDQPDRRLQILLQVAAKEIADRGEAADRLGIRFDPRARGLGL